MRPPGRVSTSLLSLSQSLRDHCSPRLGRRHTLFFRFNYSGTALSLWRRFRLQHSQHSFLLLLPMPFPILCMFSHEWPLHQQRTLPSQAIGHTLAVTGKTPPLNNRGTVVLILYQRRQSEDASQCNICRQQEHERFFMCFVLCKQGIRLRGHRVLE